MPELPEVEVLVRHLAPLLPGKKIREVRVHRRRVIEPTRMKELERRLRGATFREVERRAKYILFHLRASRDGAPLKLLGHLGMAGRFYLLRKARPLPKHTAVVLDLGREHFVYEDTRYFGRFTLDTSALARLGPEPLGEDFTFEHLASALKRSSQPIKVKLLDQSVVAGMGNLYASEALFRARISPHIPARRLTLGQIRRLRQAIRAVLTEAIECGSTVPLNFSGVGGRDGLFYFGRAPGTPDFYNERLRVYDREGKRCVHCGAVIRRITQAARSTYYCPRCQGG